ncbi:MAG: ABC transporter ATP-binding protein [Acidobacteriota bacterium]|jgi:iron complex transport system ATP-binding protein|nr:ABC transporter ATP-binding protein [Acidobacteriota bacterium]
MREQPVLEIRTASIGYRQKGRPPRVVVSDIDVSLRVGQFVCLLGPNGAGKSTLIRTIAGRLSPISGEVFLGGKPLNSYSSRELARRMSLVFTHRATVGMMSAMTLVALGRHPFTNWMGRLSVRDEEATREAMAAVGIEELARRPVAELSDGERQKVMIARALAQEPQVMILDEATAFLDLPRRVELMHLLQRIASKNNRAVLLSTHDLDLALRCADRLWLLPRNGHIHQGAPEDLVLTDSFADAFADADVRFDKKSGAFSRDVACRGTVALSGEGIPATWTFRALERTGYRVVEPGDAPVCVESMQEHGSLSWTIRGDRRIRCDSIESLLHTLANYQHTR